MASGSGSTRASVALTHRSIAALQSAETAYRVPDQRCIGLAVRVASTGLKTWDLAYRIRGLGRVRRVSLGRVADVSLEKARERANQLTRAARAGRDLVKEEAASRAAEAARLTVEQLIGLYMRRRVVGRLRTAKEIESRLMRALAPIMDWFAQDVRRRNLRGLFDRCVDQGIEREAERRRQTVGAMFRWALSQDIVEADPTAGLRPYNPGTPRNRVLTSAEVRALWKWFDAANLPPNATEILKLQLLTGARCGEISGLHVEEIDREKWLWTLPAARSKNKRPRVTPLVGLAKQIIEDRLSITRTGPLFTAATGNVLTAAHVGHYLLARRLPVDKFTTHDLRRTVATMLAEMGFPLDLVAAVIGHEGGNRDTRTLVRHYIRSDFVDRKSQILRIWDSELRGVLMDQPAERVVDLPHTGLLPSIGHAALPS